MNRKLTAIAALLYLGITPALAQTYPTKSVTMTVPFAAGGPTDIIARIVGEHMSRVIGQQIVVENIAGAGGTTGISRAAAATPDGYTIMMGHMGTHGAAPALYPNLKYNPATDFAPVGLAAGTPIVIVARKTLPAKDLKEFIAWAKAQGDKANNAYAGVGSVSHITGLLLNSIMGTKPTMIPYTGAGPALNDMISGQVDYMTDQIVNVVTQIQGGNIKAYAVALPERSPALPDVPTTKELGIDYQVTAWNAIFAPKGTPPAVVAKLADALDKALDDPKTKERLLELGGVIPDKAGRTPEALQKLVESELARWAPVLKAVAEKK